jgi:7-cyano-7-deazaguanine synthase
VTIKTVLCFSGGLDSTTLLWQLRADGHEVVALGVQYGQRHEKELLCAAGLAASVGAEWRVAYLDRLGFVPTSVLTSGGEVPHGHYEHENMKATVVPNRNMMLLSVAASCAVTLKAHHVAYAGHAGDHAIYPDCRPEFAAAMGRAIGLCDWTPPKLLTPFISLSKAGIARRAHELGVPIAQTWSCYEGGRVHCGKCGTCVERREAFDLAGIPDPTEYAKDA